MARSLLAGMMILLTACAVKQPVVQPLVPVQVKDRTGFDIRPPAERVDGSLPPGVDLADGVTADESAAVALWNNAALNADLSGLGLAQADLLDADLLRNPILQLLLPAGRKPFELWGQFPLEQLWQRTYRVKAAQLQWDQVAQGLVQNGLNTVRDARQAHSALLNAQDRVRLAQESLDLRRRIVEITQARLRAGDISQLEARASENEAANLVEQLHRFEHEIEIAGNLLRVTLGLAPGTKLEAVESIPASQGAPPDEAMLRDEAWANRPDLRALEVGIQAAAERGNWEKSRLHTLGLLLSSKGFIGNGFLTGPGLSFDVPIFQSNAGGIARSDAQVEQTTRQYLALRQTIDLEVSQARARLLQAQNSLQDWRDSVLPTATVAVEEANRALSNGDVSRLFVLETSRQLVDAQLREMDQVAAVRQAWAELDRSVGTKIQGQP